MDYSSFVKKAKEQDTRNIFDKYNGTLTIVPIELHEFYREYNPSDVELASEIGDVKFCAADGLEELQSEYAYLNAQFVFATSSGDPVFFHEVQIYTCPHGVKYPEWKQLADNFMEYLDSII